MAGDAKAKDKLKRVGIFEHHVARPRVVVPASVRFDVHRVQLPLADRIADARLEARALVHRHPDDKKRARLNAIAPILSQIPHKKVDHAKV